MTDAFTPAKEWLTKDEALDALLSIARPVTETESLPLTQALGRVLAQPVLSDRFVPPHDNSAMDGYAVYAADLAAEGWTSLPVTGRIPAGHVLDRPARPGEALRIFTGAPMPEGPDTVIPQENTKPADQDGHVLFPPFQAGENVRKKGEDVRQGDQVLAVGARLRPQEIGVAASIGVGCFTVYRRLKVALFSTGDEVRNPGEDAGPGAIYDSNRFVLSALLQGLGVEVVDFGIIRDKPELIRETLEQAAQSGVDAILTSGGVSIGEEDHVKGAVETLGNLHFWRILIRPGRPLAFGQVKGVPFIGLPGNPVASMVTFLVFARPFLMRLGGQTQVRPASFPLRSVFSFKKKPGRREWLRGLLVPAADGTLAVDRFPSEGSGILTSMVAAQGLIELAEDQGNVQPGDTVTFLPFGEVLG